MFPSSSLRAVAAVGGFPVEQGLASASGLVPIPLQLDQLGKARDQSGDFLSLIIGQVRIRHSDGVRRLAIHVGQRQTIGIDYTIAARDWLEFARDGGNRR